MKDIAKIRKTIHLLKPSALNDLENDLSNLTEILDEYDKISSVSKDLVALPNKHLSEALATQPSEYLFFKRCCVNLKGILDALEANVRYMRGVKYESIRRGESRELNDRAINSIIDGDADIRQAQFNALLVKDMYDRFHAIVESYQQRGYALNNITKSLEISAIDYLIQ
jgi:hypothetical protein